MLSFWCVQVQQLLQNHRQRQWTDKRRAVPDFDFVNKQFRLRQLFDSKSEKLFLFPVRVLLSTKETAVPENWASLDRTT